MAKPDIAKLELVNTGSYRGVATFAVVYTGRKPAQRYNLWLSLNAVLASGDDNPDAFTPVVWDGTNGTATITLPADATGFEAFVSLFPDVWTEVSNVVTF